MRILFTAALVASTLAGAALAKDSKPADAALLGQPAAERRAQAGLPQSKAPLWQTLRKAKVGEDAKRGLYTVAYPPEVKALSGQTVALSGFMMPLDALPASKHFLLAKYTPVCLFCPPGAPNEVVEVMARSGTPVTDRMLKVSGRLALISDAEKGLFFRLDGASVQ